MVLCVAVLTLSITAFPFAAGEFWEIKSPTEWTPAEVLRIQSSSPWAKKVRAEVPPDPVKPMSKIENGGPDGSASPLGHISGTRPTVRMARPLPVAPRAGGVAFYGEAVVRWESAPPVAAVTKPPLPPEFANYYVLTVTGLPPNLLETVMPAGMKPFVGTNLSAKGRSPASPEYVFLTLDKQTVGFAIPSESLKLTPDDGTATFTIICQGLMLRAKFDLKAMSWRGKVAL